MSQPIKIPHTSNQESILFEKIVNSDWNNITNDEKKFIRSKDKLDWTKHFQKWIKNNNKNCHWPISKSNALLYWLYLKDNCYKQPIEEYAKKCEIAKNKLLLMDINKPNVITFSFDIEVIEIEENKNTAEKKDLKNKGHTGKLTHYYKTFPEDFHEIIKKGLYEVYSNRIRGKNGENIFIVTPYDIFENPEIPEEATFDFKYIDKTYKNLERTISDFERYKEDHKEFLKGPIF